MQEQKIKIFLKELALTGSVKNSAKKAKLSMQYIMDLKTADETFAIKINKALSEYSIIIEEEAIKRAMDGTEEPVFYKGEYAGSRINYNDNLLLELLKAHLPEKYAKKNVRVTTDIGETLEKALNKINTIKNE